MTIQAAIKAKKEMRRKAWVDGFWIKVEGDSFWTGLFGMNQYALHATDVLATDWEVAP